MSLYHFFFPFYMFCDLKNNIPQIINPMLDMSTVTQLAEMLH